MRTLSSSIGLTKMEITLEFKVIKKELPKGPFPFQIKESSTVMDILEGFNIRTYPAIHIVNGRRVKRNTVLENGDKLTIVNVFGGG
jgi:sulfur carrier protein ThiS